METKKTHTDPKTATAEISAIATTLIARWERLVAEGEAEIAGISNESEEHLAGWTDYSMDIWDANSDLTEDEETWEAAYEEACRMWLAKYPTTEDEEEYDPEKDPDLQAYYEARLACEEAASLYGTNSEEYEQACRVLEEEARKAQVG